ncbi:MAG TPA: 50S ribosomal protein L15 [Patescibacteria group bacterium]|nr:50S ribosomal protein L15 [Patescibacteria group bacterium]
MKYNELTLSTHHSTKRVGRGISAGQGKTAGRGTKGQKSRTGSSRRPGFEGGQNPLIQRIPKLRGFTSHRQSTDAVYTGQINALTGTIDNFKLAEAGLVTSPHTQVKLILKGEINKKLTVKLQSASKSAIDAVKKAGGEFQPTPRIGRVKKEK